MLKIFHRHKLEISFSNHSVKKIYLSERHLNWAQIIIFPETLNYLYLKQSFFLNFFIYKIFNRRRYLNVPTNKREVN